MRRVGRLRLERGDANVGVGQRGDVPVPAGGAVRTLVLPGQLLHPPRDGVPRPLDPRREAMLVIRRRLLVSRRHRHRSRQDVFPQRLLEARLGGHAAGQGVLRRRGGGAGCGGHAVDAAAVLGDGAVHTTLVDLGVSGGGG